MEIKDKLNSKTKLDSSIEILINEQIKREAESSFLYQRIAQCAYENNLIGTCMFFNKRAGEELTHMNKFINYLNERGCGAKPYIIQPKEFTYSNLEGCLQSGLEHEQFITKSLTEIAKVADAKSDTLTRVFLEWFFEEQIEEEKMFIQLIKQYSLLKGCELGDYMFDDKLRTL